MKVINLGADNTAINTFMAQLRDVNYQQNRALFRHNLTRIGRAMAYELSRTLRYSVKTIQTPLGTKDTPTYDDRIVVGTVLRAGLAPEHIDVCGLCTACRRDLFWSHRKMGQARGAQIAMIALKSPQD